MNCSELRLKLHGLIDGELDPAETAIVNAHLGSCPGCTEEWESLRALHQAVAGEARYHAAPEGLATRLSAVLRAETAPKRLHRIPRSWMAMAAVLIPAALLSAGLVYYFTAIHVNPSAREDTLEGEIVASYARSLKTDHPTDIASGDEHALKPWFESMAAVAPPIRNLADSGFPLAGGRVDRVRGHAVAALVYRRGDHLIDVFIWPDPKAVRTEAVASEHQGYHLAHWTGPGIVCWAVSDVDPHDLDQLQSLLVW